MCYPSGQTVGYGFNDGGLLDAVTAGGSEVFSGIRYAPHGAPYAAVLGNKNTGLTDWAQAFNARLWPRAMVTGPDVTPTTDPANPNDPHFNDVLFGLKYTTYENNGNIGHVDRWLRQTSSAAVGTLAFTYGYDNLNRLLSAGFDLTPASGQAMSGTYGYDMDEFGNLRAENRTAGSGNNVLAGHSMPVNAGTNRLLGRTYDILGNMTDLDVNGQTQNLTYLDQGHVYDLKSADGTTLLYRYYYDAEGKRRAKAKAVNGAVSLADNCSFFFYSGEDLICQKDLGAEVVPDSDAPDKVNGAYYQPKFLLTDHLGTTRAELMFDPATLQPKLAKNYDTMPYGELISTPTGRAEPVLFSGKPRDNESGLDYFGARYYGNTISRWISPDQQIISKKNLSNPQRWDLYDYCLSNPIRNIDPDGKDTLGSYGNTLNQIRADCGEEVYNKVLNQQGKAAVGGICVVSVAAAVLTAPAWLPEVIGVSGYNFLTKILNSGPINTGGAGKEGTEAFTYSTSNTAESVLDKLNNYLLNPDHAVGGSKAAWFEQALGFTQENAGDLAKQIVFNPDTAVQTEVIEFGVKYNQVTSITGENGKTIDVTFAWIKNNDGVVRLVTAIPEKQK